jgi:hypothetical protein
MSETTSRSAHYAALLRVAERLLALLLKALGPPTAYSAAAPLDRRERASLLGSLDLLEQVVETMAALRARGARRRDDEPVAGGRSAQKPYPLAPLPAARRFPPRISWTPRSALAADPATTARRLDAAARTIARLAAAARRVARGLGPRLSRPAFQPGRREQMLQVTAAVAVALAIAIQAGLDTS